MYNKLPPQLWMLLPKEQRLKLMEVFDIKRTGPSEIYDNQVVSDGCTADDLSGITLEKMNEFNRAEDMTFPVAWQRTCMNLIEEVKEEVIIKQKDDNKKNK